MILSHAEQVYSLEGLRGPQDYENHKERLEKANKARGRGEDAEA